LELAETELTTAITSFKIQTQKFKKKNQKYLPKHKQDFVLKRKSVFFFNFFHFRLNLFNLIGPKRSAFLKIKG